MTETITKSYKPKIRLQMTEGYKFVNDVVQTNKLHTVCEEARCPNIYECWDRRTATIMILGDVCTRACGFCSVKTLGILPYGHGREENESSSCGDHFGGSG